MMKKKTFLILKLQRTGSSMVSAVLNSHKEVSCTKEILNPVIKKSSSEKRNYLGNFFINDTHDNLNYNTNIIGGTINPLKYNLQANNIKNFIDRAKSNNIEFKFILLLRKNTLKQAVSAYIAKEFLNYQSNLRKIRDKELIKNKVFDLDKLRSIVDDLSEKNKILTEFAQNLSQEYLSIFYEDILDNPQKTFIKVFDYIKVSNVPDDFDFTGGFKKILPDNLKDIIVNFNDLYNCPMLRKYIEEDF